MILIVYKIYFCDFNISIMFYNVYICVNVIFLVWYLPLHVYIYMRHTSRTVISLQELNKVFLLL